MNVVKMLLVAVAVVVIVSFPAYAQDTTQGTQLAYPNWGIGMGTGLGAALTILGAGYGISTIAGKAVESMARQPEVAGNINGAMIISAALIEGVSFFSLIVCILILVLGR